VALTPLATAADLSARNITIPAGMDSGTLIDSATDAVRDAAGCPIVVATSTVTLVLDHPCELDLPAGPVSSVATVVIDGVTIPQSVLTDGIWGAGWRKVGDTLYFIGQLIRPPTEATVTYTHGLPTVPADIVDLVCALVAMGAAQDGEYATQSRTQSVRLGDFSETYTHPAGTESPSPFAIPDGLRQKLRARFGTAVALVRMH
jgi:hypothetical protein